MRVTGTPRRTELAGIAALLDVAAPERVPLCWHWFCLLEPVRPADLDEDGYVIGSPTTPPAAMTRMFAGGRVVTHHLLDPEMPAERDTGVASTTDKQGRHGPLRFVTIRSTWSQHDRVCLVDEQDYVFMEAHPQDRPSAEGSGQVDGEGFLVTEPMLVTFSALTANPYRIHWDRDFCRRAGHDGLVVHGPLQALLMAGALVPSVDAAEGTRYSYRFRAPVTAPTRLRVCAEDGSARVCRPDGTVTATATLETL